MFQGTEHINNTVEALGTSWAWKSIGLVGAMTAMKDQVIEKVDNVKTSGPITIALVLSLITGTFAFGGIYVTVQNIREDSEKALVRLDASLQETRTGTTAQIDAIMETYNANNEILVDSFKSQLDLTLKLMRSELAQRDILLDIAYESASKGPRYTAAMAADHEDEDQAREELCDARYYETKQEIAELQHNCKDTMEKVNAIEVQHTGLGYHPSGNGQ